MKGDFTRFTFDRTKHYTGVLKQQGRVDLDADWNELVAIEAYLDRTEAKDVIGACGMPEHNPGFKVGPITAGGDFTLSTGRAYVDGILCELEKSITYRSQPDYPNPPALTQPDEPRTDLVYLDVWQRHVTAIEDPDIREVALGGPDTTTRVQTIWQVKVQEDATARSCGEIRGWPPAPANGRLTTRTTPVLPEDDPCLIAPDSGYTGLENRLYRVEIHEGGELGTDPVSFKWSRDNGSVVFSIEEFVAGEPTKVKVRRLRRDQVLALREQDWVEVLDDATELRGEHGALVQIAHIDEAKQILTLSQPVSGDPDGHPRVRRWDQSSDAIPVTTSAFVKLEDGIEVRFSGSTFQAGDYWVFAARTATRSIEILEESPRRGIIHHYCPLALIEWTEEAESAGDAGEPLQVVVLETAVQMVQDVAVKAGGVRDKAVLLFEELLQELEARPPAEVSKTEHAAVRLALRAVARTDTLERARDALLERLRGGGRGERRALNPVVRDCRHIFPPLTELRASCCVVTVGDGTTSHGQYTSIQEAVDSLPPEGGRVCVLSGLHQQETVRIRRRSRVVVSGCQLHTWVQPTESGEPAFRVEGCRAVRLENLGFLLSSDTQAIVVRDSAGIEIEHNQVRVESDAAGGVQTPIDSPQPLREKRIAAPGCEAPAAAPMDTPEARRGMMPYQVMTVKIEAASCRRLSICHNQLLGGGIGILSGCEDVVIEGNRIEGGLEHGIVFGMDVADQKVETPTGVVVLVEQPAKAIGTPVDPGEVTVIDKPPEGIGVHVEAGEVDDDAIGRLMMPPIHREPGGLTETPPLPSVEPDTFTPGGEVGNVTIRGNVITMMQGSGIAALRQRPTPDALSALVSVDGLTVEQNDILHCAQDALAGDDGESLLGGVVLAHGRQIHIHDNHIAGCGRLPDAAEASRDTPPESAAPVVGVYVFRSEGLEISHNRIVNNGSAAVGAEAAERQAGIVVEHASIQPIELQVGDDITLVGLFQAGGG